MDLPDPTVLAAPSEDPGGPQIGDDARIAHVSRSDDTDRIVREYGPYVWRALRRLGVSERDADDACQEVFVVVHRKLAEYEGRGQLRTWLYGIAVRVAAAHRRRAHVRREVPTENPVDEDLPSEETPEGAAIDREALAALDHALAALDDDKRAVFVLYEIEGLEMPEVAEALGCQVQTAYSRLYAARGEVERAMRRAALGRGGA
ncbi:RNA polymerase sigma factor RpoE [Labilithrix luteola]|uniref:RNA polymerase sigma factor RpoE n=1 Tax=Labilithrix luteola TaxID=1391654 RepID=A0A0K1QDY5_9BACT|nr:sigma-70 family RNA polymerase sigma factor [Labilithrix luteola]AKV03933.1 RNA polymerase sigma factor RpoE [Labilithrix luteola]